MILIIEDERNIRHFLSVNLRARGYHTLEAASAEEALELILHHPLELILLDVKLPGMNGIELLTLVHSEVPLSQCPVIILSAHTGVTSLDVTRVSPYVVQVLHKPIAADMLINAVRQVCRTSTNQRAID